MAGPQAQSLPLLNFPPAITIRPTLFPPTPLSSSGSPPPTSLYPSTSTSTSSEPSGVNAIPLGAPNNRYPPNYTSWQNWKEWHINPTQHGPEGSTGPPIFVPSKLKYDELGRSIIDGFDAEVMDGRDDGIEREDGDKIAGWYSTLAGRAGDENAEAGPSRPRAISEGIIDLTGDDDEDDIIPSDPTPVIAPIRVHRSEWFIRRALLKSASSLPRPPTISRPKSSISTLLNIPPQVNRAKEPMYVLGRDHIGHKILRERLGWGGGGLGKPEGWEPPEQVRHIDGYEEEEREVEGSKEGAIVISDSEDPESDPESEISVDGPTVAGPGRTAPIATTLKLDRLGLGHRLSADRPTKKGKGKAKAVIKEGEGRKKVTHSHEEIMEAQRRARYARSGAVQGKGPTGEVLGKKGKIKWKEKDKKERDERRRMIAALND